MNRRQRNVVRDQNGAVYVEFLFAFMPLFVFFLGMVQMAFIYSAKLVVDHSAYRATRSAIVVLDDDPRFYNGEGRNSLDGPGLSTAELVAGKQAVVDGGNGGPTTDAMSRRATIEMAAAVVLLPLVSGGSGSVAGALERSELDDRAAATLENLEVSILVDGAEATSVGQNDDITVRVEYEYDCIIPVISRLVCPSGSRTLRAEATLMNHGAPYPYRSQLP